MINKFINYLDKPHKITETIDKAKPINKIVKFQKPFISLQHKPIINATILGPELAIGNEIA